MEADGCFLDFFRFDSVRIFCTRVTLDGQKDGFPRYYYGDGDRYYYF